MASALYNHQIYVLTLHMILKAKTAQLKDVVYLKISKIQTALSSYLTFFLKEFASWA